MSVEISIFQSNFRTGQQLKFDRYFRACVCLKLVYLIVILEHVSVLN